MENIATTRCSELINGFWEQEFGSPHELLHDKPNGIFSQMVENTGVAMAQTLREQAERSCLENRWKRNPDLTRKISTDTDSTDIIAETIL